MIANDGLIKDLADCLAATSNLITGAPLQTAKDFCLDAIQTDIRSKRRQLLVAFSGGPDSTALLLALQAIAPSLILPYRPAISITACVGVKPTPMRSFVIELAGSWV